MKCRCGYTGEIMRRKILQRFGDANPADYGGGALVRVGPYLYLEYTPGSDFLDNADNKTSLELYRVSVPNLSDKKNLCDIESIRKDLSWVDFELISRYQGLFEEDILEIALDPRQAWELYELVGGCCGWINLDQYPLTLPYWRVAKRW